MKPIVRKVRKGEMEKVERILKRARNWPVQPYGIEFLVITINHAVGEKRWIVGVVGIAEGNRICYLAVEPNHRRNGYGRLLLRAAVRQSTSNPHLRVRFTNLKAIRLYWKEGFKITGVHDNKSWKMTKTPLKNKQLENSITARTPEEFLKLAANKLYTAMTGKKYPFFVKNTFKLNFRYKGIVNRGQVQLTDMVKDSRWKQLVTFNVSEMFYNAEWREIQTKDGTWAKRFEKFAYKTAGLKIPKSTVSQIGNIVAEYSGKRYELEIADKADWVAGDFGDSGSCWMDRYDPHPNKAQFFDSGKGYAIKMFNTSNPKKGSGRCWAFKDEDCFYLFNPRGHQLKTLAMSLADALNMKAKPIYIYVSNYGCYIDNSKGYVIGHNIEHIDTYSMDWS